MKKFTELNPYPFHEKLIAAVNRNDATAISAILNQHKDSLEKYFSVFTIDTYASKDELIYFSSPLWTAVTLGFAKVVQLLIDHKASVDPIPLPSHAGYISFVGHAAALGHSEVVKILIPHAQANTIIPENYFFKPIMAAVVHSNPDAIRELLKLENVRDLNRLEIAQVLCFAAHRGVEEIMELLFKTPWDNDIAECFKLRVKLFEESGKRTYLNAQDICIVTNNTGLLALAERTLPNYIQPTPENKKIIIESATIEPDHTIEKIQQAIKTHESSFNNLDKLVHACACGGEENLKFLNDNLCSVPFSYHSTQMDLREFIGSYHVASRYHYRPLSIAAICNQPEVLAHLVEKCEQYDSHDGEKIGSYHAIITPLEVATEYGRTDFLIGFLNKIMAEKSIILKILNNNLPPAYANTSANNSYLAIALLLRNLLNRALAFNQIETYKFLRENSIKYLALWREEVNRHVINNDSREESKTEEIMSLKSYEKPPRKSFLFQSVKESNTKKEESKKEEKNSRFPIMPGKIG